MTTLSHLMRMPRIRKPAKRDADNRAISNKDLSREVATPTLGGVRPVIAGHPAEGLTPVRLAHIHREAAEGEPLRYFELAEDIEERDLHYAGIMATRKRSVAQLPITVSAASDSADHLKQAEFVRSWITDDILQDGMFDMLDAIGKGVSIMEIDWRHHMGHTCPAAFIYRPQRWFTFDRDDGETLLLREGIAGQPLPAHKFVIHRHKSKSGLTVRSGLARVGSWAWMFKQFTIKDWAIFCQNYGQPIRIGRYGRNAKEEEKAILWRAVRNIAGDCAAIMPEGMSIEFVSVSDKGTTSDLYEKRADWLDRQMSKAVLGQTTTTDAVSGGHAVSKEHRLVQEDIERSDARMVSTTINRQIIPNLIAFNFGPQEVYPKVKVGRPDEPDLDVFASAFAHAAPQGLTAPLGWMRDRFSIPAPKDGEEVVGGKVMTGPSRNVGDDVDGDPGTPPAKADLNNRNPLPQLLASHHLRTTTDDEIDALTIRLERDASGAMAGLQDAIRAELMAATSLADAADRLATLNLDPTELAQAMARGMALAHLAGQASLIDDLRDRHDGRE